MRRLLLCSMVLITLAPLCAGGTAQAAHLRAPGSPPPVVTDSPTPTPTPTPPPSPTPLPTPVGGGTGSSNGCPPGQFGFAFWPAPLCFDPSSLIGSLVQGLATIVVGAIGSVTGPLVTLLTDTPDYAGSAHWGQAQAFFAWMRLLAGALVSLLAVLTGILSVLRAAGHAPPALAFAPLTRLGVAVGALLAWPQIMIWWFEGVQITTTAISGFQGTLATDLLSRLAEMAVGAIVGVPLLAIVTALFAVVALVLMIVIGVTRVVGDMLLLSLYIAGPVTIALWVFPPTAHIARAWVNAFLSVSFWGPAYALVLKVIVIAVVALPSEPALYGLDLLPPMMGLGGLIILYRVPRIVGALVGTGIAGAASVTGPSDVLVGVAQSEAHSQIARRLP